MGARKDYRRKLTQNKMIIETTLTKVNISAQEANINKVKLFSRSYHRKSQRYIQLALEKWQVKPTGRGSGYIVKIGK